MWGFQKLLSTSTLFVLKFGGNITGNIWGHVSSELTEFGDILGPSQYSINCLTSLSAYSKRWAKMMFGFPGMKVISEAVSGNPWKIWLFTLPLWMFMLVSVLSSLWGRLGEITNIHFWHQFHVRDPGFVTWPIWELIEEPWLSFFIIQVIHLFIWP